MSHSTSGPASEQRLSQAFELHLFSHTAEAEASGQQHQPVGEGAGWRETPFAVRPAEARQGVATDDAD
jgi:hypothetical protein